MNRLKILGYASAAVLIVTIGVAGYEWQQFLTRSLFPKGVSIAYELKPKTSIHNFTKDLQRLGLLDAYKGNLFILLSYLRGDVHHLKAGEYLLEGGNPPSKILNSLVHGDVIRRHITFVEGWNFEKMLEAMRANPYLRHNLSHLSPDVIMVQLGHPGVSPEGQFFPDTYIFTRGVSDSVILKKAYALMQARFDKAWDERAPSVTYQTPYQALIAASIIEKESGFKSERPLIAGVLLKRWKEGIPLQIDSTVSYGLGGPVSLSKLDLVQETPYNTYINRGWPPTPIAMPSLDSIHAALHPQASQFIYFVATGEGGHHFSASLNEHHAAVMHYRSVTRKFKISLMPYLLPRVFAAKPCSTFFVKNCANKNKIPYRVPHEV